MEEPGAHVASPPLYLPHAFGDVHAAHRLLEILRVSVQQCKCMQDVRFIPAFAAVCRTVLSAQTEQARARRGNVCRVLQGGTVTDPDPDHSFDGG